MSVQASCSKRPRLSLQIKNASGTTVRTSRTLALVDNPKSPTTFNTLSNVYVTAIERSTPLQSEPITAINTQEPQTATENKSLQQRIQTPYTTGYPETPLTAHPTSPVPMQMQMPFPSIVTAATPPMSAGPVSAGPKEGNMPAIFTFPPPMEADDIAASISASITASIAAAQNESRQLRRRATLSASLAPGVQPPYIHPRGIHSILRNSPLPPLTIKTPISPRRQSLRLQEKAARRVAYNSPLTQTITTSRYVKSHIDLLCEDASPMSPLVGQEPDSALDTALSWTGNETRDGGQTPGPFEEMRRRMASLGTTTPVSPAVTPGGIRKRKRKDNKKRRWVWTIGQDDDDREEVSGAMAAARAAEAAAASAVSEDRTPLVRAPPPMVVDIPTPSIESMDSMDMEMSDTSSFVWEDRALTPADMEVDLKTPTVTSTSKDPSPEDPPVIRNDRLGSVDLINPDTGSRRDTPVPPDMLAA
jgi:hypothetical protein